MEAGVTAEGAERRGGAWKLALVVLVIVAATVALGILALMSGPGTTTEETSTGGPSLMSATCSSLTTSANSTVEHVASGGNSSHAYFLIVAADPPSPFAGFNGSYYASTTTQWPTMHVRVGQVVSIRVINCASSEAHGFQVTYYDDKSIIAIQPGQSYEATFTATVAGTFRVYCDIFCAIHPFMQNGALVVA